MKAGKNDSSVYDIKIGDFEISWNLGNITTFAVDENSVNEIGCIHTSQGFEFDYAGVIIGDDMRYEDGHIVTDFTKRAKTD
ncbi:MAG: DNA/RNA helicase domain-containing protein [Oliverpabstia sp.]